MAKDITHGVTSAGAVTTVTLTNWHYSLEIISRGAGDFFVRTDRQDPTNGGDECEIIMANSANTIANLSQPPDQGAGQVDAVEVRIWCSAAVPFSLLGR